MTKTDQATQVQNTKLHKYKTKHIWYEIYTDSNVLIKIGLGGKCKNYKIEHKQQQDS
jgi:hypothetical protein